jgi:hypothetical protein
MNPTANSTDWKLEVVRGQDAGRVFALEVGEVVLGNAPGEQGGIDLAAQELVTSPRRMSPRHASIDCSSDALTVRDLESPGGTFVNRQRVLPGQSRPLRPGDVIQLGGVQLKVVGTSAPAPPPPQPGAFTYQIPEGPTCRSWDDLLTASAQRWETLREELVSGRLAGFLDSIGRSDLAPKPNPTASPDERFDAWLAGLPTIKAARPELDVHPERLVIRVVPGVGTIRRTVQVANVGHRLLRSTARLEPAEVPWLKLEPRFAGPPFLTIEETSVGLEIAIPASLPSPLSAELVIEGNGGSKRVEVILEVKPATVEISATPTAPADPDANGQGFAELIARQSPLARVATWSFAALVLRILVGVASGSLGTDAMKASGPDSPALAGVAVMLGGVGGLLGGLVAARRGGSREAPAGAFAGGFAGVVASTAVVACCRTVEPILGGWATSVVAVCGLWALIGAALAGLSLVLVKGKS